MSTKKKVKAEVLEQTMLAENIFDMWITTELAADAHPGQFVGVYSENGAHLLPRPISICQVNEEKTALRIVYRIAGEGTAEFSKWHSGKHVELLGILGNGFPVQQALGKRVLLLGGGIGLPPMLELARTLQSKENQEQGTNVKIVAGYRDSNLFLREDLEKYGEVYIATEDGSAGTHGNVLNAIEENEIEVDMIMACGPMPMLRAIKQYAEKKNIQAYISLEERMACGVGACLGCVCKTAKKNTHSHVNNARICTDGPVFNAQEVEI